MLNSDTPSQEHRASCGTELSRTRLGRLTLAGAEDATRLSSLVVKDFQMGVTGIYLLRSLILEDLDKMMTILRNSLEKGAVSRSSKLRLAANAAMRKEFEEWQGKQNWISSRLSKIHWWLQREIFFSNVLPRREGELSEEDYWRKLDEEVLASDEPEYYWHKLKQALASDKSQ